MSQLCTENCNRYPLLQSITRTSVIQKNWLFSTEEILNLSQIAAASAVSKGVWLAIGHLKKRGVGCEEDVHDVEVLDARKTFMTREVNMEPYKKSYDPSGSTVEHNALVS